MFLAFVLWSAALSLPEPSAGGEMCGWDEEMSLLAMKAGFFGLCHPTLWEANAEESAVLSGGKSDPKEVACSP